MDKDLAKKNWNDCLRLVMRGYADEPLPHPLLKLALDSKIGKYDDYPSAEFSEYIEEFNQMTFGMWRKGMDSTAGDVLLTALRYTNISDFDLERIVDILASASARTQYNDEFVPLDGQPAPLKDAVERSRGVHKRMTLVPFTPRQISEWLHDGGHIVGQDDAVKAAATIVYNHFSGRPSVSIFAGTTGSGKTQIWRSLQKRYGDDRIVIVDASALTAEGWSGGTKVSTIFKAIPPKDRQNLILVLDEADKILTEQQVGASGTDHAALIQNQLLKLFDHDVLHFFDDSSKKENTFSVDASGISIVMTGAFQKLMEKKARTVSIGFGNVSSQNDDTELTVEDLIDSGMRPELCGRVDKIVALEPLDANALIRIARNETDRLSDQMQRDVLVDSNTLAKLADEAVDKGLGARWINSQLRNMLDNLVYENPDAERFLLRCETSTADNIRSA